MIWLIAALGIGVHACGWFEQRRRRFRVYAAALVLWPALLLGLDRALLPVGRVEWGPVLLTALVVFISIALNQGIAARKGWQPELQERRAALRSQWHPGILGLFIVFLAPIFEETFFRGALFEILAPYGPAVTLGVTAILFSAAHVDWAGTPGFFLTGLILGYLRYDSGGLAGPVLAHILANGMAFAGLLAQGSAANTGARPGR